ncbi:MAG: hypothetical protein WEE67_09545 [Chloroflexota bacterium]
MTQVLSTRELNRELLARQLLLKRSPLSVPKALEQIAGIQNQYAPSAYVRLWSSLRTIHAMMLIAASIRFSSSGRSWSPPATSFRPRRRQGDRRARRDVLQLPFICPVSDRG